MSDSTYKPAKIFTIDEANSHLPLIRAIAGDMVELAADLADRRRRLDTIMAGRDGGESDVYAEEVAATERELRRAEERLSEYIEEISDLGAETKSVRDGLIDFPAMMDGRLVYLCWKHNEAEVLYWRELDAGVADRQRLELAGAGADDCVDDGTSDS